MGVAVVIVLDTHAWVCWVSGSRALSRKASERIDEALGRNAICVSSISCWEVALLVKRGRLELKMGAEDWIAHSEALPYLRFVPVDNHIALRSVGLPGRFHDDPADRIIVATALSLGAKLITKDRRIRRYRGVETLW